MKKLLLDILSALWNDDMAARRWLRGASHTLALGGLAFADQIAALINAPGAVKAIKLAAIVCAFMGGAISVGEKNAQPTP